MVVVADSTPLIALADIGHISILPALFREVIIPAEVSAELRRYNRSQAVRDLLVSASAWLLERTPAAVEPIPGLHAGESAAISLAQELKADLLLIDEKEGRRAAAARHIPFTGTIGVLELAADRELLDLQEAFVRLRKTDFWISPALLDDRLRLHRLRKAK